MSTQLARYLMDPAEDVVLYGDDLTEGMWVLREDWSLRNETSPREGERLRGQRFCRVTRLRRDGDLITFIGEWVDGYQEAANRTHVTYAWIVKKASLPIPGTDDESED